MMAVTLAIVPAAIAELAGAEEMFRPVLRAGDTVSCKISNEVAGCARFEGYIYVSPTKTDGASRDGFGFGPASSISTPALDEKHGYLHLGSAKP